MLSPVGVAESPEGDGWYAYPAGGYFSMKKSNQKSLGEGPETPTRRSPPRPETLRIPGELGPPAGRKARWGKEDAPQRGGLPEA